MFIYSFTHLLIIYSFTIYLLIMFIYSDYVYLLFYYYFCLAEVLQGHAGCIFAYSMF